MNINMYSGYYLLGQVEIRIYKEPEYNVANIQWQVLQFSIHNDYDY